MSFLLSLSIDLAHDDVDGADDGGDVGDEAAAADFVRDAEIGKAGRASADAEGDGILRGPAHDVEAHLSARALGLHVGFAGGERSQGLDAVRALGLGVARQGLFANLDAFDAARAFAHRTGARRRQSPRPWGLRERAE